MSDTRDTQSPRPLEAARLRLLIQEIEALRQHAYRIEERFAAQVGAVHADFREGAKNLLHYLALRSYDLRGLQEGLAELGLSSLGRTEAHAMASLNAVRRILERQLEGDTSRLRPMASVVSFQEGERLARHHAEALLGPQPEHHPVRIMVTLPSEAAQEPELVRALIEAGMDVARINCAHDDASAWRQMAAHVRAAAAELGRPCTVEMDLAGPKIRTGPLVPGPRVVRWRPERDQRGHAVRPARLWLAPPGEPPPAGEPVSAAIPVDGAWLEGVQPGDRIRLRDARGKKRRLKVVGKAGAGRWGECDRTGYVETGTQLELESSGAIASVGVLPALEQSIVLRRGDRLLLTRDGQPGRPAYQDSAGAWWPARVPCTLPEGLGAVQPGDRVKFDDGKIEAVVHAVSGEGVSLEVRRTPKAGCRLRADKGINFPDTELPVSGLTHKDVADLDAVVELADVVGLSFVQSPDDVTALQDELAGRGADHLGVLLKIETERAFQELPWLLLAAMRSRAAGVMIARGDLAVECGWERMAELQEEILWFCEAAHVPVVWATQVLESLAKRGTPSRAEITDAAMANRAECVMLNKGPHIVEAIRTLDDILLRMHAHQHKKTAWLSRLDISTSAVGQLDET
jgi:pyruvate kinase